MPRPAGARPGAPAPWPHREGPITLAEVRAAFADEDPSREAPNLAADIELPATVSPPAPAAVLIPLFEEDGACRVVLTRRSTRLRSHTGQVAFPGGRLDPGEAPVSAALREAAEEVGLDPATCRIIGELAPMVTVSSETRVMPFVGVLPGRPMLHPNPAEVDRVFDVTLSELADPGVFQEEIWPFPGAGERPMYLYALDGDTVWGATARMLKELLDRVVFGGPGAGVPGTNLG